MKSCKLNLNFFSPSIHRALKTMGKNITLARLRRKMSIGSLAQRSGISVNTLIALESGEENLLIVNLARVIHSLGLINCIEELAQADKLGRGLQDAELLASRKRAPKVKLKEVL